MTRERDEYLDALQRLKAEFDNYRKRTARDQEQLVARAHERLAKELLPVLDDLERALAAAEQHEEAQLEEGVRLVHRSLVEALQKEGVAEIETTASSIRTSTRRCSRSRTTRRNPARSSTCCRRAIASATGCSPGAGDRGRMSTDPYKTLGLPRRRRRTRSSGRTAGWRAATTRTPTQATRKHSGR